jgi:hypothetical protein
MDTDVETVHVKGDKNEPIGKKVMSCGNLLTRVDILIHQPQKEFSSCDFGGSKFE